MVAMTVPDLWADPDRLFTVDDLEDLNDLMADDDRRLELDDGILIVSPFAANIHQLVVTRLMRILGEACPENLVVLPGVGINVSRFQHRIPDVAVVAADSFGTMYQEEPPALAVEVSSPSTRIYDRSRKKDVYEGFGIPAYWIVEPDRDAPRLVVFELCDGKYEQRADVTSDEEFRATRPFPVTIRPATLVRTGPLH
jgi:Uma2 family endonuclease